MTEHPRNVASIVATALADVRSRIAWVSEGQLGGEEFTLLLDLERDLEAWDRCWGVQLAKFEIELDQEIL